MSREQLPLGLTRAVKPAAFRQLLLDLSWEPVLVRRADVIAAYHAPGLPASQVIVPIDQGLADYGEAVGTAVNRLAEHQQRPARDILDELLLPQADLFQLEVLDAPCAGLALPLDYTIDLLAGARKALLAIAQSVLVPRAEHLRLDSRPAERLVAACQVVRPDQPTFALRLVCPLAAVPSEGSLMEGQPPFVRHVTVGLMQTLKSLTEAADRQRGDELLRPGAAPLLSANLCEAIASLCPTDDRQSLTVSACWAHPLPPKDLSPNRVVLGAAAFALAEYLAPRLRSGARPQPSWHFGFVEGLDGKPGPDERPAGEVRVAITRADEVLHARLELGADDYALANTAHLSNVPVYFRGVLYRAAGLHHIEQVGPFLLVQRPELAHAS